MKTALLLALCIVLASCATRPDEKASSLEGARATLPQSSAECLAQNLKPGEPFPASAIPEAVLRKAQSGWVAMRYDVIAGVAKNVVVVASSPAGVYDAAAVQHAARYRDPSGSTVRGCIMTIDIKF